MKTKYFYLNNSEGLTMGIIGASNILELVGKICICFAENMSIELDSVKVLQSVSFDAYEEQDVYIGFDFDGEDSEDKLYLGLTALY